MTSNGLITAEQLYDSLRKIRGVGGNCHYTLEKCTELVPTINEINRLKKEKNAVVLVHSYVVPEIVYGVADFVGDSYGLSKNAIETDADTIVFVAVRFMGETAKILNPAKDVLIPAPDDGCTLADCVTGEKVRQLRQNYPDHTFVCYINTTADVKAECDVCVTSTNAFKVIEQIKNEKIFFLPDRLMGENLRAEMHASGVEKDIQFFDGTCHVHEEYGSEDIARVRTAYPNAKVVSHPECQSEVTGQSDFVGSTSQMLDYVRTTEAPEFLMLTECGLSSRLQVEFPNKRVVGSCTLCRFMKSNTLEDVKRVLTTPTDRDRVVLDETVRQRASRCIHEMFKYAERN